MTPPHPESPELSIIIVTYNSRRHVRDCLESVQRAGENISHEVIVVDNASQDGTPEIVRNEYPKAHLIGNPENLGFARANNQGIARSRGRLILLLNPDTVVPPHTLATLLKEMDRFPKAGVLGCRLLNEDRSLQMSFGYEVGIGTEVFRKLFFNLWENHRFAPVGWVLQSLHARPREVDWIKGACMLLRREAIGEAPWMDETFFLYLEDADLCRRIRQSGWQVRYTPEAEVVHPGGGSVRSNPERSALEHRRSQLHYFKKHWGTGHLKALKIYLAAKMRKNLLWVTFKQWTGWGAPGPLEERKRHLREVLSLIREFQ